MDQLTESRLQLMLQEHRQFFHSGRTRDLSFRLEQLNKLLEAIRRAEPQLLAALRQDLRKSEFEAFTTEISFVQQSIRDMKKHLGKWMKPQKVPTPLALFPSSSRIVSEPYGTVLIIGPFNYPFQLVMEPLIGAIAAGNCAALKPSEHTPSVSAVIRRLIGDTFEEAYIRVIEGEKETTSLLIHAPFDYIFFTGSVPVGKLVMEAAARHLVPVTLELGGKSPVIVDTTAKLELAAKRILWGKLTNAGQTCIAPDYVLVQREVRDELLAKMKETIAGFYGPDASASDDYGRIVNLRHFDRLAAILEQDRERIAYGGRIDREALYIEPTLLLAAWDDAAMADEIFGPILPILTYDQLDEAIAAIRARPKPLALYVFTESKEVEKQVISRVSFGGGCVNDTLMHVANPHLPFGGVGSSGVGAYHGKHSFDVFSHRKSIVHKSTRFEPGLVFPPYKDKLKWVKKLLK
ncbi:aldehyde dehydrogenase (NAD+) [Paenibacillus sp. UNCCL117]|uniref:aldehyde dehydrogenase n=1 Tax=unclassified Paenibacillus TaxID=185978 RepID=UPI00088C8B02|nr:MULTISPECIES: aldehyde dehydrogenase [unclassified Paenibacillus]SDE22311.1 aldehyde dehydrogenase (NAD+) [Paenibacillus sp. cl123]SFW43009.1 aldehyde dehydrogenase (NAD+) [Paenibacillus sp. UNCCL117]